MVSYYIGGGKMTTLEQKLQTAEALFPEKIETNSFFNILFEMNRYFDKQFVILLHNDSEENLRLNQNERNLLRKYYYYGVEDWLSLINVSNFPQYAASEDDKTNVLDSFLTRCETYDKEKIVNSVIERYTLIKEKKVTDNSKVWLKWFDEKRNSNSDFSLFVYDYEQKDFINDNYNVSKILETIADIYDHLENYRYFIFKLHGKLFNENEEDVTWKILYKIGIYLTLFLIK